MRETRGEKYGRNLAYITEKLSNDLRPEEREAYLRAIAKEVRKYSFRPRKEGEPIHEGCRHSMKGIDTVHIDNPEEVAALVKESCDLTYNKTRAAAIVKGFLRTIKQFY